MIDGINSIINPPLKKILDELNNHVDRETYTKLEETLKDVAKLIKSTINSKGEVKENGKKTT